MSNTDVSKHVVYAILADSVYWDVRERYANPNDKTDHTRANWTPVPNDWTIIHEMSGSGNDGKANNPNLEGFTARAYQNSNFS